MCPPGAVYLELKTYTTRWYCFWDEAVGFLDERESTWKSPARTCSYTLLVVLSCDDSTSVVGTGVLLATPTTALQDRGKEKKHRACRLQQATK
jgi:hypothetical protein